MSSSLNALFTTLFCYLLYRVYESTVRERRFRLFANSHGCSPAYNDDGPFPWGLQRIYKMLTARKRNEDILEDLILPPVQAHPTLERTVPGGSKIIETADPQNCKAMFMTNSRDYQVSETRSMAFRPVTGKSIFTTNGAEWEHYRSMLKPQFTKTLLNNLDTVELELENFWKAVEQKGVTTEGWTASGEMSPFIYRLVTDIASDFLFGESIGSQKAFLEKDISERGSQQPNHAERIGGADFSNAYDRVSEYVNLRLRFQVPGWILDTKEFRASRDIFRSMPDKYIQKALAGDHAREGVKYDLLSALVEQTRDPEQLKNQALSMFNAGRDTQGTTMHWTVLMLGQHPRVFDKMRSIVLEAFPLGDPSIRDPARLKGCQYLQHVLQETLRLYSPVPINSRQATKDTVLPVGGGPDGSQPVALRKGQVVLIHVHAMHRRKDLWGDDALEFKPERWEDQSKFPEEGVMYSPFSYGRRNCIGREFTKTPASALRYDR